MSHFAQVENGIVTQVIIAEQDFIDTISGTWFQTSYNTRGGIHYAPDSDTPDGEVALRANYAGIGYTYDATNDVFYAPQPFPSWVISAPTWQWQSPIPVPTTDGPYKWDETIKNWIIQ